MPWPNTEDAADPGVTVPWIVVVEVPPHAATAARIPAAIVALKEIFMQTTVLRR